MHNSGDQWMNGKEQAKQDAGSLQILGDFNIHSLEIIYMN